MKSEKEWFCKKCFMQHSSEGFLIIPKVYTKV